MSQKDMELREKFLFTLEWLLAVTKRYTANLQFGLVQINFADPAKLGDLFGAQEANHKLDDILHCLSKAFRKTDLVARDGVDFWIIVPYASTDEKLVDRVRYIIDIASQIGLEIVERDISLFPLPLAGHNLDDDCSAVEFLAYLKNNHDTLASHERSMAPQ